MKKTMFIRLFFITTLIAVTGCGSKETSSGKETSVAKETSGSSNEYEKRLQDQLKKEEERKLKEKRLQVKSELKVAFGLMGLVQPSEDELERMVDERIKDEKEEEERKKSAPSSSRNLSSYEAEGLAEKYIDSNPLLHGHMGLDYYSNFSDPDNGVFTFYGAVCYGSSEYDCSYESLYIITQNNGRTWSIEF